MGELFYQKKLTEKENTFGVARHDHLLDMMSSKFQLDMMTSNFSPRKTSHRITEDVEIEPCAMEEVDALIMSLFLMLRARTRPGQLEKQQRNKMNRRDLFQGGASYIARIDWTWSLTMQCRVVACGCFSRGRTCEEEWQWNEQKEHDLVEFFIM